MPQYCDHLEINKAKMLRRSLNILPTLRDPSLRSGSQDSEAKDLTKEQLRSIGTKIIAAARM